MVRYINVHLIIIIIIINIAKNDALTLLKCIQRYECTSTWKLVQSNIYCVSLTDGQCNSTFDIAWCTLQHMRTDLICVYVTVKKMSIHVLYKRSSLPKISPHYWYKLHAKWSECEQCSAMWIFIETLRTKDTLPYPVSLSLSSPSLSLAVNSLLSAHQTPSWGSGSVCPNDACGERV